MWTRVGSSCRHAVREKQVLLYDPAVTEKMHAWFLTMIVLFPSKTKLGVHQEHSIYFAILLFLVISHLFFARPFTQLDDGMCTTCILWSNLIRWKAGPAMSGQIISRKAVDLVALTSAQL